MTSNLTFKSEIDRSVNFITPCEDGGYFESRFVQRNPEYFIAYISSHSGCKRACTFCHLTATKQVTMTPATNANMCGQLRKVLKHYKSEESSEAIKKVHINWMARGEPMDNRYLDGVTLQTMYDTVMQYLGYTTVPRFNISTIMPKDMTIPLAPRFAPIFPDIYYSLYSMHPNYRYKFLPNSMDPDKALDLLKEYQDISGKVIHLHGAFIKGFNDTLEDANRIIKAVRSRNLLVKVNIVRYNPPDAFTEETCEPMIDILVNKYKQERIPVSVVPRVGFDVKASCGMFYNGEYDGNKT